MLSLATLRKWGAFLLGGGLLFGGFLWGSLLDRVRIQSLESKTAVGDAVFNEIRFLETASKEIWMMNQSHHGHGAPAGNWDRLAIVVEEGPSGHRQATYYQLPPGPLEWDENLPARKIEYRVSCFMCHSNGPRAIRPDRNGLPLSWREELTIAAWNLKIKLAGRIQENPAQLAEDSGLETPFRHREKINNETLEIETCSHCHKENGWLARGTLTRQNALAISFMLKEGLMPPPGFRLPESEKKQIEDFLKGF